MDEHGNKNWDEYFMGMCDYVATKSKDDSTRVGAVIVGRERKDVRGTGFNGFPRGIIDMPSKISKLWPDSDAVKVLEERLKRPLKYTWTVHSEQNAILSAAAVGVPLAGCMIYVNSLPPCAECSKAIIQCGIVELVYIHAEIPERWQFSCGEGLKMLNEVGVLIRTMTR